jgi:hypothetical protein
MTEREAAMTSIREFQLRLNGYKEHQQVEWDRASWTAFSIFSPFVKNGPKTPKAWVRFPWEKPKAIKAVVITEKKENQLNNLYMDFMSRKNKIRS